ESFVRRIREKLLNLDFDVDLDRVEAAHALGVGDGVDAGGDEDPVVQALEPEVDVQLLPRLDGGGALAELLGHGEVEFTLAQLAGAVHEVVDLHDVRGGSGHGERVYALTPSPARSPRTAEQPGRIIPRG